MAAKVLTIEVGNDFIKICEAQQLKGKSVTVHNAVSIQTPEGAIEDGIIRDMPAVANAIKNAMTEEQIVASSATFILSSARVATKEVIIPVVKKEKIQEMINVNASEYFPVNIDDYVLSYTVLETKNTKDEKKTRVLVFAAPEMMVKGYYELAEELKMKVNAVDYIGNSTLQLIKIQIDERPTLVIQMGMDSTIVSVMNHNVLQLQRTVPYGESLLLNEVMEDKKVSAKVAIELMGQAKLVKPYLEDDKTTGSLKYLVSNVNRVVEYYTGRNAEAPLQTAVIIGDGAEVLGLEDLFTNELNLHTERVTLLKNVESYNRIKLSTSLLKLYMANIGATISPINFQTKEMLEIKGQKTDKKDNSGAFYAAAAICVVAAAGLFLVPFIQYSSAKSERDGIQEDIDDISDIKGTVNEYYKALDTYNDLAAFDALSSNDNEWVLEFIDTLGKILPKDMKLSGLNSSSGLASFTATCKSKSQVADLVDALKGVENITAVVCSSVTEAKDEETNANIVTCIIQCNFVKDVAELETSEGETAANGNKTNTLNQTTQQTQAPTTAANKQ